MDEFTLQDMEEFIGAPLPPSAYDIQFDTGAFLDRIVWLRFGCEAVDWPAFAEDLGFDPESMRYGY
ncbi:hypothetical protein P6O77_15555, partial [Clostridium perfringens]|nr:hypothetical protein [Clostridium perfringens]